MLNHITLCGRLTKDPELRHTNSGVTVAGFTLAVERDLKDASGERKTDFVDIVAWRGTGEFAQRYFHKGDFATVTGRLEFRDWTDKAGQKRRSAEVVANNIYFVPTKKSDPQSEAPPTSEDHGYADISAEDDDGLPF